MNKIIESLKSSASIDLMKKAKELREQGVDIIDLSGGEPDFDTPKLITEKAIAELRNGNTHYAVGQGIYKLRKRISQKLAVENGVIVSADEVLITPGAKMAIYLSIRSCINEGDEVLILNPAWVSYADIVVSAGGVPVMVQLNKENNYQITEEALEYKVSKKTKMIILNTPNNPTGRVLNNEELLVLKHFVKKWNLTLLSDEVYEKIIFDLRENISPASDEFLRERTITVNGFSKSYAMTGWRLGYLAASKRYIDVITKLYTHTITGTSPFIQEAASVAFDCVAEVEHMRQLYEERRNEFVSGLNAIPGINVTSPEGAFYAWVNFAKNDMDSEQVADFLLEKAKVIGVPGVAYGEKKECYIRFSFAKDKDVLYDAVKRIKNVM